MTPYRGTIRHNGRMSPQDHDQLGKGAPRTKVRPCRRSGAPRDDRRAALGKLPYADIQARDDRRAQGVSQVQGLGGAARNATLLLGAALFLSDMVHHFLVLWPVTGSPQFDLVYPEKR